MVSYLQVKGPQPSLTSYYVLVDSADRMYSDENQYRGIASAR